MSLNSIVSHIIPVLCPSGITTITRCVCHWTGKGENIWDKWCHEGGHVYNNDTGDIACDSYNLYNQDIAILQNAGVRNDLAVHLYSATKNWREAIAVGIEQRVSRTQPILDRTIVG